jgi:beta-xylosidase
MIFYLYYTLKLKEKSYIIQSKISEGCSLSSYISVDLVNWESIEIEWDKLHFGRKQTETDFGELMRCVFDRYNSYVSLQQNTKYKSSGC